MSIEQQFLDAVADFRGLLADGWEATAALNEAAQSNGLKPAVLEQRLSRHQSVESIANGMRHDVEMDVFDRAVILEIKDYYDRPVPSGGGLGYLFNREFILAQVTPCIERRIGRPLKETEASKIHDRVFDVMNGRLS